MLSRVYRLSDSQDIAKVFKYGRQVRSPYLVVRFGLNKLKNSRFVVVAGLKVHKKATKRNLVKRRLREILRLHKQHIVSGLDIGVLALSKALELDYKSLEKDLLGLLEQGQLLKRVHE